MATWNDLAGYLRTNYKIAEDNETHLVLHFGLANDRSQLVHVGRANFNASAGDWAMIASVFGTVDQVDLRAALMEASEYVVGGVVQFGDTLAIKHSVPLANLDINEFEEPFHLVIGAADSMEHKFTGGDAF